MYSGAYVEVPFTNLNDDGTVSISFAPVNKYKYPLEWFIKDTNIRIAFVIALIIAAISPKFSRWVWAMWIGFGILIVIDHSLFFERWPWRYLMDGIICIIQLIYTFNLAYKIYFKYE